MTFTITKPPRPVPNVALLKRTLAQIETDPEHWHQHVYAVDLARIGRAECGTAYCYAGRAIILHGNTIDPDNPDIVTPLATDEIDPALTWVLADGRTVMDTGDYAAAILGLTRHQGHRLFSWRNNREDLRHVVAELCGEAADVTG